MQSYSSGGVYWTDPEMVSKGPRKCMFNRPRGVNIYSGQSYCAIIEFGILFATLHLVITVVQDTI
jgi:hypothetical protein